MKQFCLKGHDTFITGRHKDGKCILCVRDRVNNYYKKHRTRILKQQKQCNLNNKVTINAYAKQYRQDHRESILIYLTQYRKDNKKTLAKNVKRIKNILLSI